MRDRRSSGLGTAAAAVLSAVLLVLPSPARAATEDELAHARTTFFEGVRAQEEGRFRQALDRYTEVRRVIVSPQLLFNIATCHEHLDELVEARANYREALAVAREKNEPEVAQAATARAEALEKEIPHVVIRLASRTEGAEVVLDDVRLESASLDDIRLNPGLHRLYVRSEQHVESRAKIFHIHKYEVHEIDVDLGPLVSEMRALATPRPAEAGKPSPERPLPKATERPTYVPAIVGAGATAALAVAAIVTGIEGVAKRDRYDELNGTPTAANRPERAELREDGQTLFTANAALVVGTVLAAGVTTYLFIAPPKTKASPSTALSVPFRFTF